jgi:hypothetical protein
MTDLGLCRAELETQAFPAKTGNGYVDIVEMTIFVPLKALDAALFVSTLSFRI